MLRMREDLEVGQEFYLVNDVEPLKGTFQLTEIQEEKLLFIDKFDRHVEVLIDVEDDFKMFYSKTDFLEYEAFIKTTLNKLRYLETFTSNHCKGNSTVTRLLNLALLHDLD